MASKWIPRNLVFNPYMTKEGISMSATKSAPSPARNEVSFDSSKQGFKSFFRSSFDANSQNPEESLRKNVARLIKEEQERQQAFIRLTSPRI